MKKIRIIMSILVLLSIFAAQTAFALQNEGKSKFMPERINPTIECLNDNQTPCSGE